MMQFNSIDFMLFFPIVLLVYFVIPKKLRMYWLLLTSYYFYMCWNAKYAFLMGLSTVITWFSGILFSRIPDDESGKKKRIIMVICICINLGILAIYKYGNFGIEIVNAILSKMGCLVIDKRFNFLLPVGISFYTFQALGYMIDVYRGDVEVEKNIFRYALFVSFFPQLIQGPISRFDELSKSLFIEKKFKKEVLCSGLQRILWGYFKKLVIADRILVAVNTIIRNPEQYQGGYVLLGAIFYAIELYADFTGGIDITIGIGELFGIQIAENFKRPFFSKSVKEYWNRWHISMGTWFRDYVYIPLGGSRCKNIKRYRNILLLPFRDVYG